jgi:basic amino acid/polyamine antiporter, APA family
MTIGAPTSPRPPRTAGLFITRSIDALQKETDEAEGPRLRRALGPWALIAIGLGNMVGAGIFATIGTGIHDLAGPAVIVSFGIAAVISALAAMCYAELSSMVPVAGSAYTYTYATVGEIIAWIIGWNLIWEYGMAAAPVAGTLSANLQNILQQSGVHLPAWATSAYNAQTHAYFDVIAFFSVLVFSTLLAVGIRESAGANSILVVLKMGVLALFVVIALPFVNHVNWHPFAPFGWRDAVGRGIIPAAFSVFFAFIGFDAVTTAAEEAKRPQRDVPMGVLGSLGLGALFYIAIAIVLTGMLPYTKIDPASPLPSALEAVHLPQWAWITVVGALIGTSSVILTSLLGQSRIFFVMARDGLLPKAVAAIHPRFRTPAAMTMVVGFVVALVAGFVPLPDSLNLVNLGTLSAFTLVSIGVIILRYAQPDRPRGFRAPFVPVLPALAAICAVFLALLGAQPLTLIAFGIWLVIGVVIYFAYGYRNSEEAKARSTPGAPPR